VNYLGVCISDSSSVTVYVVECTDPEIPNVLTPNGDGVNDMFYLRLNGATCAEMTIYNRWGQMLFTSNHINIGWDGTVTNTGLPAPEGTYFYLANFCRYDGSRGSLKGSLTLFR
jgi:gliding motility-associated-like protein